MEYFDVLDKDRKLQNYSKKRGTKLLMNEYNQGAEIYIVFNNKILVTQRSKTKSHPNMWEVPGGCSIKGETTRQTIVREIKEEIGLNLTESNLKLLNTSIYKNMFIDIFLYNDKIDLTKIKLDEEEVNDFRLVSKDEINTLIKGNKMVTSVGERYNVVKDLIS